MPFAILPHNRNIHLMATENQKPFSAIPLMLALMAYNTLSTMGAVALVMVLYEGWLVSESIAGFLGGL